jgi:hypothetical protein
VEAAVLLGEVVAERQLDLDPPRLDARECRADQAHHLLADEALADAGLERGVLRLEGAHAGRSMGRSAHAATP